MSGYKVPKASFSTLSPRGFEVSIPHKSGITLFAFHGRLNKTITQSSDQDWGVDILKSKGGKWTYTNRDVELNSGDVINYWITVRYNGLDYHSDVQKYCKGLFW